MIERANYTFLGVLSDVGGLSSVIASVFASLLAIINYNNLNAHMTTKLYKFRGTDASGSEGNLYKPSKIVNIISFFMEVLPSFCVCCKKPRRIQQLEAAMDKLNEETDLI